ncbi:MAG: hypothetical protein QF436_00215 [Candidatus Woesearchaeota archaeon]|jgi:hypothetical protein|nr:hypothetical protein [Candidatus Woesearchaeota archaeon]MDP7622530.1 hypothetical protein [Candidatus Woesearchaeota archaeon]HJN56713.1 hypothetical protein [Candidatus Woesearchaeota archaeon]|tara:strand:- start:27182 stop:27967 length:786 start_codon:yes stop_codon:yes gene_type:complete
MSAEKEVVNFWLNRKGYFTVNNLKSKNKDIGILALKFDKTILEKIMHLEVNCSITGIADQNYISNTIIEKFDDKGITNTISDYSKNMKKDIKIEKIVVLNSLPKEKKDIIGKLEKKEIKLVEFEDILSDVMQGLNTGYFKDDVTRTLQLVKFLLVQNPKKFVDVLEKNLSQQKMKEMIAEMLDRDGIVKEFKKTNEERLALILKQAMIKPESLAKMLENDVLNRKTRKPFISSLIKQEKIGIVYKKEVNVKKEKPLSRFFG